MGAGEVLILLPRPYFLCIVWYSDEMKFSTSTHAVRIRRTFEMLKSQSYEGVSGVLCIDSGVSGPVVGMTACTHGNEPAGLAIFAHLLEDMDICNTLLRGTLFLVVNNVGAANLFFDLTAQGKDTSVARYVDINMNRLPKDVCTNDADTRYEACRTRELLPLWKRFDYGMDVHSTTMDIEPMIISKGDSYALELARGFPVRKLVSHIDRVQLNTPVFAFYGGTHAQVCAIEAGQHEKDTAYVNATMCAKAFLQNAHMLSGTSHTQITEYREFFIDGSVVFDDVSYDFVTLFQEEECVREGQVLATSSIGLPDVRAPFEGVLIMPSTKRGSEKIMGEEQSFISRPMRVRRV